MVPYEIVPADRLRQQDPPFVHNIDSGLAHPWTVLLSESTQNQLKIAAFKANRHPAELLTHLLSLQHRRTTAAHYRHGVAVPLQTPGPWVIDGQCVFPAACDAVSPTSNTTSTSTSSTSTNSTGYSAGHTSSSRTLTPPSALAPPFVPRRTDTRSAGPSALAAPFVPHRARTLQTETMLQLQRYYRWQKWHLAELQRQLDEQVKLASVRTSVTDQTSQQDVCETQSVAEVVCVEEEDESLSVESSVDRDDDGDSVGSWTDEDAIFIPNIRY